MRTRFNEEELRAKAKTRLLLRETVVDEKEESLRAHTAENDQTGGYCSPGNLLTLLQALRLEPDGLEDPLDLRRISTGQ